MEELKIDSGIKKIAIKNEDDELVCELKINVADAETIDKFAKVINDLNNISARIDADVEEIQSTVKDINPSEEDEISEEDIAKAVDVNKVRVKYIKEIADKLDEIFGEGTIKAVYGDTVPDELALVGFVENIMPVMKKLFGKRLELSRKKYNSKRRGNR